MLFNRIVTKRILFLGASIVTEILVGLLAAYREGVTELLGSKLTLPQ